MLYITVVIGYLLISSNLVRVGVYHGVTGGSVLFMLALISTSHGVSEFCLQIGASFDKSLILHSALQGLWVDLVAEFREVRFLGTVPFSFRELKG